MPSIEYRIASDNFCFMTTLNNQQLSEYFTSYFQSWHLLAVQQLMRYEKFKQQLMEISCRIQCGIAYRGVKRGQNGTAKEPMNIEARIQRISKKRLEKEKD